MGWAVGKFGWSSSGAEPRGELMVCGLYVYRSSGRRPLEGCVYEF